jgi:hypothetical protein
MEQTILETFDEMHAESQVALAFMLKHACRCAQKVYEKHDFGNGKQNEAADWWKTSLPS